MPMLFRPHSISWIWLLLFRFALGVMIVTVIGQGAVGQLKTKPISTFAVVGEQLTLSCATNHSGDLEWRLIPGRPEKSTFPKLLSIGGQLFNNSDQRNITVLSVRPGEYNLVVKVVNELSHSGYYICYDRSRPASDPDKSAGAEVIVLKSRPTCTVDGLASGNPAASVIDSKTIQLSCSLEYFGTTSDRSLRWLDAQGQMVKNSVLSTRTNGNWTAISLSIDIQARVPQVPKYTFTSCVSLNKNCSVNNSPLFEWPSFNIKVNYDHTTAEFSTDDNVIFTSPHFTSNTYFDRSTYGSIEKGTVNAIVTNSFRQTSSDGTDDKPSSSETLINMTPKLVSITTLSLVGGLIICVVIIVILISLYSFRYCRQERSLIEGPSMVPSAISGELNDHVVKLNNAQPDNENPYENPYDVIEEYTSLIASPAFLLHGMSPAQMYLPLVRTRSDQKGVYLSFVGDIKSPADIFKNRGIFSSVPNVKEPMYENPFGEYLTFTAGVTTQHQHSTHLPKADISTRSSSM